MRGLPLALALGGLGVVYVGLSLLGPSGDPLEVRRAYGELARSIIEGEPYRSCGKIFDTPCLSAHRLPLIPAFLVLAKSLHLDTAWASALKQILFILAPVSAGTYLLATRRFGGVSLGNLGLLLLLMLNPVFLRWANWKIDVEEGYLAGPLFFLGAVLAAPDPRQAGRRAALHLAAWTGISLAAIYLTKSSLFYFAAVLGSVLAVRLAAVSRLTVLLILGPLLLSLGLWMAHTTAVLGSAMVGTSIDTFNLYKGNNPRFSAVYPRGEFNGNLDGLDADGTTAPTRVVETEAELYRHYRERVIEGVRQDPAAAVRRSLTKAFVFFFDPRASFVKSSLSRELVFALPLAALKAGIWVIFIMALMGAARERYRTLIVLMVVGTVLYAGPLLAGFAYQHHVFPLAFFLVPMLWALRESRSMES